MLINGGMGISFAAEELLATIMVPDNDDNDVCVLVFLLPFSKLFRSFSLDASAFAVIGFTGEPVCVMDDWLSVK